MAVHGCITVWVQSSCSFSDGAALGTRADLQCSSVGILVWLYMAVYGWTWVYMAVYAPGVLCRASGFNFISISSFLLVATSAVT